MARFVNFIRNCTALRSTVLKYLHTKFHYERVRRVLLNCDLDTKSKICWYSCWDGFTVRICESFCLCKYSFVTFCVVFSIGLCVYSNRESISDAFRPPDSDPMARYSAYIIFLIFFCTCLIVHCKIKYNLRLRIKISYVVPSILVDYDAYWFRITTVWTYAYLFYPSLW